MINNIYFIFLEFAFFMNSMNSDISGFYQISYYYERAIYFRGSLIIEKNVASIINFKIQQFFLYFKACLIKFQDWVLIYNNLNYQNIFSKNIHIRDNIASSSITIYLNNMILILL